MPQGPNFLPRGPITTQEQHPLARGPLGTLHQCTALASAVITLPVPTTTPPCWQLDRSLPTATPSHAGKGLHTGTVAAASLPPWPSSHRAGGGSFLFSARTLCAREWTTPAPGPDPCTSGGAQGRHGGSRCPLILSAPLHAVVRLEEGMQGARRERCLPLTQSPRGSCGCSRCFLLKTSRAFYSAAMNPPLPGCKSCTSDYTPVLCHPETNVRCHHSTCVHLLPFLFVLF